MKRRHLFSGLWTVTLASICSTGANSSLFASSQTNNTITNGKNMKNYLNDSSHFLSTTNPVATVDQLELEKMALEIAQLPAMRNARENAGNRLKILVGDDAPEEAWSSYEDVLDQWVFQNALKAANSDSNYPKVLGCLFEPEHEWFDLKVPSGVGFGGVNPDNNYSVVPIDGQARFELVGQCFNEGPVDVQFTVTGNFFLTITLENLDWQDVQRDADGKFVITLDPEPAKGRPNHMQTGPDATFVLIRDVRGDWRQLPNAYRIRRIDPPSSSALTFQQKADRAVRYTIDDVAGAHLYIAMNSAQKSNTIRPPFSAESLGGLVTQVMSGARLKLRDDEAFVVTVGHGGSKYHVLPLYNYWQSNMQIDTHTSCMNSYQSVANVDEDTTTYVISIKDAGVYNWIDTVGLHEPRFWIRWHMSKQGTASNKMPWIKGELVKLDELKKALPSGTRWVTQEQRKLQLAERLAAFGVRHSVG